MLHEVSISHSRRDNLQGRITPLVGRIHVECHALDGCQFLPFFDATEI